MSYKVLVVEDSTFFQQRLKEIINEHPELDVCGIAEDGCQAVELAAELKPDIISMDYEMPLMDGVSAVRSIMANQPIPIVMFSSMTYEGARITLDAMAAGAVDFIPKNFAEVSRDSIYMKRKLQDTLLTFVRKSNARPVSKFRPGETPPQHQRSRITDIEKSNSSFQRIKKNTEKKLDDIKVVIIGCSTGGPVALTEVIQNLPANFSVPVVIIQHMPEKFTKALADRLNQHCKLKVLEARSGDPLKPGSAYIAPGGQQLLFNNQSGVRVLPGDNRVNYKPSLDITFASASNVYGRSVLGIVLTGMGADGCEGARLLKQKGATIWSQDQASCTVYGMPRAIADAKLTDEVIPLKDIGMRLQQSI